MNELEDERKDLDRRCSSASSTTCRRPSRSALAGDEHPFKMLVTTLEADHFLGRILTGRIESGAITVNRKIKALNRDGKVIETRPRHQAAGVPRPGARAGRARRSRRHRRHRRPGRRHRRRHAVRPERGRADSRRIRSIRRPWR